MRMTILDASNIVGGLPDATTISGWVDSKRNHGKITFIDLRDHTGILQCVSRGLLGDLNVEDVVELTGECQFRPENMQNPDMATGKVEFVPKTVKILNKCKAMPIPISTDGKEIAEDKRLECRYLDLRRERLQTNIRKRAKLVSSLRHALEGAGFIEIETPILTQSTKEGARDFVVPSRFHQGQVYALPQSPQQYKQMLMTAGFEKYYQIARCFRDEALRLDRGFEFTQLDLEIAFAQKEWDVIYPIEQILQTALDAVGKWSWEAASHIYRKELNGLPSILPVFTYEEAMAKFGTDKPDIRTDEQKAAGDLMFCWIVRFPMFKPQKDEEVKDSKSAWTFMHNPFSAPYDEHKELLLKGENVDKIIAQQYDLVCNGLEIGSGSIRAHTREMLTATYKVMGYSDAEIQASVGHMLEAFDLGTPPHGGIALGIDRLAMLVCGETSMKEVVAFPMTGSGRTSIMDAPTPMTTEQEKELGIKVM